MNGFNGNSEFFALDSVEQLGDFVIVEIFSPDQLITLLSNQFDIAGTCTYTIDFSLGHLTFFLRIFESQEREVDHAENPRIKGSRYFNSEFIKGEIFTTEANLAKVPLRYDAFYDTFQFKLSGKYRSMPPSPIVKMVKIENDVFLTLW